MTEALVVPMRVEALPVGERDATSGGTAARSIPPHADFAAVAGRYAPYVGAQVVGRLFGGGRPLEPGIHVHWHLPRALLRAEIRDRDELAPPPAPDRWLVAGGLLGADGSSTMRAWVVESNFLAPEPLYSETSVPRDPREGGQPYAYLGRVFTLAEWLRDGGQGPHHPALTGFGYGIPDFAGCYANCRNVFGLHDRDAGGEPGTSTLSYAVVGWHADPDGDPLSAGRDPRDLGWMGTGPGPRRTLYFGSIHGVRFDPAAAQLVSQQSPLTPEVAVGNTLPEALAALAAKNKPELERLFTAFQLGSLRRLGGLARVEQEVHAASFASVDAGLEWEVASTQGDPLGNLDADVAHGLSALNAQQREYDAVRARRTAMRRRVFADWYRRAQLRAARWRPDLDLDGLDELIEAQLVEVDRMDGDVDRLHGDLRRRLDDLRAKLAGESAKLVKRGAPRFYRPSDPVVVLSGEGIVPPPPDAGGDVACVPAGGLRDAPAVAGLEAADRLPHPEAAWLVRRALAHGIEAVGLPAPEIALRKWSLPWRPIELAWRVALQIPGALGATTDLEPDAVLGHFELDATELDLKPHSLDYDGLPDEYEGRAPLAANASAALERLLDGVAEPELVQRLRDLPLVAQSLGGFHLALTMLDQGLQLPVADPYGSLLDAPFVEQVAAAVGDQARFAPLPDNPFAPLRSGRFELTALRLVDEFGRWREIDTSEAIASESIPQQGRALLPPLRLTQFAQVSFRWRIASRPGTQASNLPTASPICGWVVPNRLDHGLMLYNGDGSALGRFTPGAGTDPPVWFDAPGISDATGTVEGALGGRDDVLAGFVRSLADGGAGYLLAFSTTLDETRAPIAPGFTAADQALAVLLGEPLVLVQAEIDLSLLGLPALDMSLAALRADIARGAPVARTDRGVTRVRFPALLGHFPAADDGLVGFYLPHAGGETVDFGRFFAAAGGGHDAIQRPSPTTITLAAAPDTGPVTVTMLMDPRCAVHVSTGILPVSSLSIPGDLTTRGLAALDYTFLTGPLIAPLDPAAMSAPAPAAPARWQWISRGRDGWHTDALAPSDPAMIPAGRQRIVDGWLKIDRLDTRP